MNPFKALIIIVKAFNDRYNTSRQDEINQKLHAEALYQERRYKTLLQQQINEIITVMKRDSSVHAVKIEIAQECVQYLPEILKTAECELTQMDKNVYLLQLSEEELG